MNGYSLLASSVTAIVTGANFTSNTAVVDDNTSLSVSSTNTNGFSLSHSHSLSIYLCSLILVYTHAGGFPMSLHNPPSHYTNRMLSSIGGGVFMTTTSVLADVSTTLLIDQSLFTSNHVSALNNSVAATGSLNQNGGAAVECVCVCGSLCVSQFVHSCVGVCCCSPCVQSIWQQYYGLYCH